MISSYHTQGGKQNKNMKNSKKNTRCSKLTIQINFPPILSTNRKLLLFWCHSPSSLEKTGQTGNILQRSIKNNKQEESLNNRSEETILGKLSVNRCISNQYQHSENKKKFHGSIYTKSLSYQVLFVHLILNSYVISQDTPWSC